MRFFSLSYQASCRAALIGSVIAGCVGTLPSFAQVSLSPLFLEAPTVQGRAQGTITLINPTDHEIRVRAYSEPFTYDQNGFVSLSEDSHDLSPYLQFSPREVVIPPGVRQSVRLLGLFPPDLAEGEYRAVVFAEELTESTAEGSQVVLRARVGSTVYMHHGNDQPSADLVGTAVQARSDGTALDVLIHNQGSTTARGDIYWQLHQDEREISRGQSPAQTVIAERDRLFPLPLSEVLESGTYTLTGEVSWTTHNQNYSQIFELPVVVP